MRCLLEGVRLTPPHVLKTFSVDPVPIVHYLRAYNVLRTFFWFMQAKLEPGSKMLDFGANDGEGVARLADIIDADKFSRICLYDQRGASLDYLDRHSFDPSVDLETTAVMPEEFYDVVHMGLAAHYGVEGIDEAAFLASNYFLLFDYDLGGRSLDEATAMCDTFNERKWLKRDPDFIENAARYSMKDYDSRLQKNGFKTLALSTGKFCVIGGKRNRKRYISEGQRIFT